MGAQESEELYRVAVEHSRDGVALIRGDKHLYVNAQLLHMLGCASPDELVGKSILLSVHPDDREMVARFVRKGEGGGSAPDRYEFRIVTKTGVTRHVEVSAARVTYDGEPVGLAFLRDITERKMAEEALRESEEKFRLLFEKSMDPILLLDGDTYADCNEASLRLMGCSRDRLVGLHPWDISPERQPDGRLSCQKASETIATALREGVSRFEWLHHTFDGQELWADVSLTVVPIGGRQIMYTVWRDIEKRKRAE
jgi:PAS domain S-box-containing protein